MSCWPRAVHACVRACFQEEGEEVWGLVSSREMAFHEARVYPGPPMVSGSLGWLLPMAWVRVSSESWALSTLVLTWG